MTMLKRLLTMGRRAVPLSLLVPCLLGSGCGSGGSVAAPAQPAAPAVTNSGPQTYFSGAVNASPSLGFTNYLGTYTIDDSARTFAQTSYLFGTNSSRNTQNGPQVDYSGTLIPLSRGLLGLSTSYSDSGSGPVVSAPPITGSWAIELAGQAGGLIDLNGFPFTPIVPAEACPNASTPQSFNFVTIPTIDVGTVAAWDPQAETAYGSVKVSGDGTSVLFSDIEQFALDGTSIRNYPTIGITPAPVAYTSITGECSPTFYGNTTSVTGTLAITNPGVNETIQNSATLGIGPTGLLVESNGNGYTLTDVSGSKVLPAYQPFMGAGTGALGLPTPSAPLTVSALTGAQYLGFFYNFDGNEGSSVASFGFSSAAPASCAAVTAQTSTLIYGGDFLNNDPSAADVQASGGFGNCDVAIDLGAQDPNNNGLFPNALVTEGASFPGSTGTEVLPGVAIAGTLNGKFAIFLITSTAQGIYLLQSN